MSPLIPIVAGGWLLAALAGWILCAMAGRSDDHLERLARLAPDSRPVDAARVEDEQVAYLDSIWELS